MVVLDLKYELEREDERLPFLGTEKRGLDFRARFCGLRGRFNFAVGRMTDQCRTLGCTQDDDIISHLYCTRLHLLIS